MTAKKLPHESHKPAKIDITAKLAQKKRTRKKRKGPRKNSRAIDASPQKLPGVYACWYLSYHQLGFIKDMCVGLSGPDLYFMMFRVKPHDEPPENQIRVQEFEAVYSMYRMTVAGVAGKVYENQVKQGSERAASKVMERVGSGFTEPEDNSARSALNIHIGTSSKK